MNARWWLCRRTRGFRSLLRSPQHRAHFSSVLPLRLKRGGQGWRRRVERESGQCRRGFVPSPRPSLGERENRTLRFRQPRAPRLVAARDAVFPLPQGEGQGEGERDTANQNGRTNFASATRPAPRVRVGCPIERRACRWTKGARSQAHRCFEGSFPLTPPSIGERENHPPPANASSPFCRLSYGFISRLSSATRPSAPRNEPIRGQCQG